MTVVGRRVLYASAMLVFIVVAPALILYAQGFRFDLRTFRWSSRGGIYLSSNPSGAVVSMDGVPMTGRTPLFVRNVQPGSYRVDIVREGYQPWSDTVSVRDRTTAKIDATLLPVSFDSVTLPIPDIILASYHRETHAIAVVRPVTDGVVAVEVVNDQSGHIEQLVRIEVGANDPVSYLSWSFLGKHLAVRTTNGVLYIFRLADASLQHFVGGPTTVRRFVWSPTSDTDLLLSDGDSVWLANLRDGSMRVIASPNAIDVGTDGNRMWALINDPTQAFMLSFDTAASYTPSTRVQLDHRPVSMLGATRDGFIYQTDRSVIITDSRGADDGSFDAGHSTTIIPSLDQRWLLIMNDNEAWVVRPGEERSTLIGRYADLASVAWYPGLPITFLMDGSGTVHVIDANRTTAALGRLPLLGDVRSFFTIDDRRIGVLRDDNLSLITFE